MRSGSQREAKVHSHAPKLLKTRVYSICQLLPLFTFDTVNQSAYLRAPHRQHKGARGLVRGKQGLRLHSQALLPAVQHAINNND